VDEAVEERAALVAESRTAVRVRLELVFGPSILQGHKIRFKLQVLIDRLQPQNKLSTYFQFTYLSF
jgi:hypothetical protein